MKVLVTGGAGFIGGNFVHHMVNKYPDYQIVNLDLLTYAGNLETLKPVEDKPNYKFVKGDIADEAFIMDLFEKEKFDVVVNFAAESHVDRSIEDPGIFVQTNVMGTRVLLDASRKFGVKRYHQVSTDEVTETFRWIARTCSLQRIPRSTPPARTLHPRQAQTCLYWLTTEPSVPRLPFPDAPTTTARITSRKS